jgi:hypothetical protein
VSSFWREARIQAPDRRPYSALIPALLKIFSSRADSALISAANTSGVTTPQVKERFVTTGAEIVASTDPHFTGRLECGEDMHATRIGDFGSIASGEIAFSVNSVPCPRIDTAFH